VHESIQTNGRDDAAERRPGIDGMPVNGSPYGTAENYGSPGGDEPPETTDPGSGSAGDARERREPPDAK
jgi:hypothetical protein